MKLGEPAITVAEFVHRWEKKDGAWKQARVLSLTIAARRQLIRSPRGSEVGPMRAAIRIQLNEPAEELVHRFQNFGEDVYRALRDRCSISIDEIDRATHMFEVHDIPRRDVGLVVDTIRREVRRHHFEGSTTLVRLDRPAP